LHAAGQGLGEHKRGGGLEFAAQQVGGAGRLEAQGPPVLTIHADLGEFHPALRLLARPGTRATSGPLARENRLMRLSVKVRGGGALEVKVYRGSPGILEVAGRARGRMESWQKWSFPFSPPVQDRGAPAGWRAVRKRQQVVAELVQGVGGAAGVTLERGREMAGSLAVQPFTRRVLLHALSFSGKAVHLAVDSVSDSRFAVGRHRPGLLLGVMVAGVDQAPSLGHGEGWGEAARGGPLAAEQVRRELSV
jgi:hypothetical protein